MRHQSLDLPGVEPVESDVDSISAPKGRNSNPPVRIETPAKEMARLLRSIGGKAVAGEPDYLLIDKAARRFNHGLPGAQQIGERRARSYWFGEIADVPSHHMDRARALAESTPIEEAINVLRAAKLSIDRRLEELLDEVVSGVPNDSMDRRRLARQRRDPVSPARPQAPRLITAK